MAAAIKAPRKVPTAINEVKLKVKLILGLTVKMIVATTQ
jgi:hypothetical protein